MARTVLACAVLAMMLALASADRGLFQATKECKSTKVTLGKLPPCVSQFIGTDPKNPKVGVTKSPRSITEFIASADAACKLLGKGEADPSKAMFGSASVDCNNGQTPSKGVAWETLYCCATGTTLANWRETRAFMGTSAFARSRDTLAFAGCAINGDPFDGCAPSGH